nr:xylulose kinase-1 [Tanacetum cinerariifolium]
MVTFLSKPTESDVFEQIVDFLNAHPIRYALTFNPTIYISCIEQFWSTAITKTINGEAQLHAKVDGKKIIVTESSVRRDIRLADEEVIDCLPNSTIFEILALMGPKTTAWNEFNSTMASAIICLASNQKSNFSKLIFDSMIRNLDDVSDEAIHKELDDSLVRAATTASSLEAEQDSSNITKTQSKATPNESSSYRTNSGGGPGCQETIGDTIAQTRVLDLEKTKTTQQNETDSLKRRVKKLEKRNRSRTHKLKKLYKVGLTARVESSGDEESLGEDAPKQERRIDAIDLAERLQAQEQEELSDAEKAKLFQQLLKKRRKHFTAKRAEEKRNKPPTQA